MLRYISAGLLFLSAALFSADWYVTIVGTTFLAQALPMFIGSVLLFVSSIPPRTDIAPTEYVRTSGEESVRP